MRVRLIKEVTIENFANRNAQSRKLFELWLGAIRRATWIVPDDILTTFPSTDHLGNGSDRAVFNIGGNKYRMICHYVFGTTKVHLFINWVGTHAEYDRLCKLNRQFTISIY